MRIEWKFLIYCGLGTVASNKVQGITRRAVPHARVCATSIDPGRSFHWARGAPALGRGALRGAGA